MSINHDPILVDAALLQHAERLCLRRVAGDERSLAALHALALVYRKQGNLNGAAAIYARMAQIDPVDPEVRYLNAVFSGSEWPPSPSGIIAAPFVLVKDVLPPADHDSLLPLVASVEDALAPAMVGDHKYVPAIRESLDLPKPLRWDVTRRFHERLKELLPRLQPRLNVPPFDMDSVEFKVRVYKDGHFFRVHMDSPKKSTCAGRKVSYVYFFHKMPRAYTGGDLVLFDSDIVTNRFSSASFTRVVPEDNALIVFPSAYWHCVVPLRCDSSDFTNNRFVINGHCTQAEGNEGATEVVVPHQSTTQG